MARARAGRAGCSAGGDGGRQARRAARLLAAFALTWIASTPLGAEPADPPPAWPTSPWHGMVDGNGDRIPCRCRFAGREWRLGDIVCMSTHVGTVLARCDLNQNNTSWVPTSTPCELSRGPPASGAPPPRMAGLR